MGHHFTPFFGHHHIVLDANTDATPLLIDTVIIRCDIQPRLHRQGHARLQLTPLILNPVITHIVNVQAQPVARAMHEETAVALGFHQLVELTVKQPQIQQTLGQNLHHFFVGHIPVIVRMGGLDGGVLTGQHQLVERLLGLAERTVHWEGTGDIRGVVFQLATGIYQHQIPVFELLAVIDVMQDATVGATTDNTRVRGAARTMTHKLVDIFRLELIFHHPRADFFHGTDMGMGRDACRLAHQLHFRC